LNAITEQLESLDFDSTPGHLVNSLKREELIESRPRCSPKHSPATSDQWIADAVSSSQWRSQPDRSRGHPDPGSRYVRACLPHDFGANAQAYIDTFQRNIDWVSTQARYEDASKVEGPRPLVQKEFGELPGVGVEEVKAMLDSGTSVQIIDARPRSYTSRRQDIIDGAVWRDPERVYDWIRQLSKSDPVVVFCAYGFHVGCKTAIALRDAGFDARYMKGGHSAWKAIGGPLKLYT
jgi:rhodanese-related sulfurtransferase